MEPSFEFNLTNCLDPTPVKKPRLDEPPVVQPPPPPVVQPPAAPASPPAAQTEAQKQLHALINGTSPPAEEGGPPDPQTSVQKMLDALINGPPSAQPAPLPFAMPPPPSLGPPPALDRRHAGLLREDGGVVAWMQSLRGAQADVQHAARLGLHPEPI